MQAFIGQLGVPNVPKSMPAVRGATDGDSQIVTTTYTLTGITRDNAGAVLGNCLVKLFRTGTDELVSQTVSDANGVYTIPASSLLNHYLVVYKAGAPDVAGTTVNTLVGS